MTGTCPPGRSTTLTEELGGGRPGWLAGEARLVGVDDALAADNVYPFVLCVRPQPTYVLLTRQATGERPLPACSSNAPCADGEEQAHDV